MASLDHHNFDTVTVLRLESHVSPEDQALIGTLLGRMGLTYSFEYEQVPGLEPDTHSVAEATPGSATSDGSAPKVPSRNQLESIANHGYVFRDLTQPDHVLVREHIENLAETHPMANRIAARNFTQAFHLLFNQLGQSQRLFSAGYGKPQVREPQPMPGIVLERRNTLGFSPYDNKSLSDRDNQILAQYGARIGSIVTALDVGTIDMVGGKSGQVLAIIRGTLLEQLG